MTDIALIIYLSFYLLNPNPSYRQVWKKMNILQPLVNATQNRRHNVTVTISIIKNICRNTRWLESILYRRITVHQTFLTLSALYSEFLVSSIIVRFRVFSVCHFYFSLEISFRTVWKTRSLNSTSIEYVLCTVRWVSCVRQKWARFFLNHYESNFAVAKEIKRLCPTKLDLHFSDKRSCVQIQSSWKLHRRTTRARTHTQY